MDAKEITKTLYSLFTKMGYPYMSCNTTALHWGQFECDFVAISKTQRIVECEVKISRGDFFADFKKALKHKRMKSNKQGETIASDLCVNYFYYAVPENLIKESEIPDYAGLIYIDEKIGAYVVKSAPRLHKGKTTDRVIIKILRSVMFKYFTR